MEIDESPGIQPDTSESLPPHDLPGNNPENQQEQNHELRVVGIGASAGGLAAFEQLFNHLPTDTGMAFVVIQHLSYPHHSILPDIIQRYTSMPVSQVTDGIEVEPDHVYVIPPGSDLALKEGRLMLHKPETEQGSRLPIDRFFRSLAQVQGDRAIGIVLSGTLSDGSLGLKTIKAEGGLTIVQEPDTAEFGDMPRNAIATKDVDYILPPQKMGELILKYIHHQILDTYKASQSDFPISEGGLQKLFYLLSAKTGHDFSHYKQNTLRRRIERRMKISLVKDLDGYIERLQEHPEEVEALFQELLINVTHFFRDQEAFQALAEKAIRSLIPMKHATHTPLRVWVAGCSSGEEAYSIAILIREQIHALKADCKVQIYATDIDREAIDAARKGFFSDGSLENVSAERLQSFFNRQDQGYQVKQDLRDMVVFSTQNLIFDPPFSKIDLLCCRNLLIYLEHEIQNQLIRQFHYAINTDGILFLGNSESIGENKNLFGVVDRKYKIFRRKEAPTPVHFKAKARYKPPETAVSIFDAGNNPSPPVGLRSWAEKVLLEFHTPACVVIDPKHNILFIHGRTGKYLELVPGDINTNLVKIAREGLKTELATALHTAITRKEMVRRLGLQVKTNGDFQPVNLTVRPLDGPPGMGELILVVFDETQVPPIETPKEASITARKNRREAQLEKELQEKDEYLNTIIDELEEANQDLKSANEEMQSSNEELQSANEELETSKEELQSVNEELVTINTELQNKNEELTGLNNDVYNLLASTDIGTIFLDLDLNLRRFTPAIQRIYNFLPADIGRPIGHIVSNLAYDHLVEDIQQVVNTLVSRAIEVQAKDGAWYLINIRPYRTLENVIDGAVITFVDITQQKRTDELLRIGTVIRDSNDAVTMQDFNGKILAWNRGASRMYGWTEAEALTMNSLEMTPESRRAEILALFERLSRGETIGSFETQRVTRDGRTLDVWLTLTALLNDASQPAGIATTERDITERKRSSQMFFFENRSLKAASGWYETILERAEPQGKDACQILVEKAGYRLAWIGKVEKNKAKTIIPVTWAGIDEGEIANFTRLSRKPANLALDSRRPVAIRNIPADPAQKSWRADALKHGYGSFLALPLIHENNLPGVLLIYAAEPEAFVEQEVENLFMLSRSIALVMDPVKKELERRE
ncbi:MAG: CheR family methyltransferase [Omnitrophica WOR_2 bacterium]